MPAQRQRSRAARWLDCGPLPCAPPATGLASRQARRRLRPPSSPCLCLPELNMAYSQHEIVGDYVRPTLMWLESKVLPVISWGLQLGH